MSIKAKLVVATVACMAALAAAMALLVSLGGERTVTISARQAISDAGHALAAMERADVEKLDATLRALEAHPGLEEAFAARDRERLLAIAEPVFASLRKDHHITHFYFLDPEPARTCFLRVHKPEQFGDVVNRATLTRAIETKGLGAGKELGRTAFALRVVRPWFRAKDGALIGYAELGEEIDSFLGRMKAQTGDEYGLLVEKSALDEKEYVGTLAGKRNNWGDRPNTVVVDSTTRDESIMELRDGFASLPEWGQLLKELNRGGATLAQGAVPVRDAAGRRVGALFVLHDITPLRTSMTSTRARVLAALAVFTVLLTALLLLLLQRVVVRRLERMRSTMEDVASRLAGGEYDVEASPAEANDELGKFETFFGGFISVIAGLLRDLTRSKTA